MNPNEAQQAHRDGPSQADFARSLGRSWATLGVYVADLTMKPELLLFLHGLGGDPKSTWGSFPALIEQDSDLGPKVDIGYFQYPTSLFQLPFIGKLSGIQTLARALRTQINNAFAEYDTIILVCHSLGGLIARKYLIDEVKKGHTLRVSKLLLFSVPNDGADLATVAKYVSWWHTQIRQLCKNSDVIAQLNEDWFTLKVADRLMVTYVVAAGDRVVDERSAQSLWGNPNLEVLADRGHIDCVKPRNPKDLAFRVLKNFVLLSHPGSAQVSQIPPLLQTAEKCPIIKLKRIYCAYTSEYEKWMAKEDAKTLNAHFPGRVIERPHVNKAQLEKDLSTGEFEIVHLVGHTEPHTGAFLFDDSHKEQIKADALLQLVTACKAHLVFLATCNSTVLASRLSKVATTIAAYGDSPASTWVEWERTFYSQLAIGKSVYSAYELAQGSSEWPMTMNRNSDAVFQIEH